MPVVYYTEELYLIYLPVYLLDNNTYCGVCTILFIKLNTLWALSISNPFPFLPTLSFTFHNYYYCPVPQTVVVLSITSVVVDGHGQGTTEVVAWITRTEAQNSCRLKIILNGKALNPISLPI